MKVKETWRKTDGNNVLLGSLTNDGFFISYNLIAGADKDDAVGAFAQMVGGLFTGEGEPQEETALYDGETWRILLGDFRKQYAAAYPKGLKACLRVYNKYKTKYRSEWSTDHA